MVIHRLPGYLRFVDSLTVVCYDWKTYNSVEKTLYFRV